MVDHREIFLKITRKFQELDSTTCLLNFSMGLNTKIPKELDKFLTLYKYEDYFNQMNNIDYSKWHGSMFCRICVKELNEKDRSTEKVKINNFSGWGSTKVKVPVCNECGARAVGFTSKMCFETNPIQAYLRCFLYTLFISGFLFGMLYILGTKEGVDESTAYTGIALLSLGASAAMIYIINRQNTISKEIIQKIESRY